LEWRRRSFVVRVSELPARSRKAPESINPRSDDPVAGNAETGTMVVVGANVVEVAAAKVLGGALEQVKDPRGVVMGCTVMTRVPLRPGESIVSSRATSMVTSPSAENGSIFHIPFEISVVASTRGVSSKVVALTSRTLRNTPMVSSIFASSMCFQTMTAPSVEHALVAMVNPPAIACGANDTVAIRAAAAAVTRRFMASLCFCFTILLCPIDAFRLSSTCVLSAQHFTAPPICVK
jgi:hypothetical protein